MIAYLITDDPCFFDKEETECDKRYWNSRERYWTTQIELAQPYRTRAAAAGIVKRWHLGKPTQYLLAVELDDSWKPGFALDIIRII